MTCDRKMNVKINVYRTMVGPELLNGVETWAQEKMFDVTET